MTKDMKFGMDPMDVYTVPVRTEETKLSKIFTMQVREKPEKPGRALAVMWDAREPLIDGFENKYSYVVTFKGAGNKAGNHYHEIKRELFIPVAGRFTVIMEDINTKEREEVILEAEKHQILYVPTGISHVTRAESDIAMLLVVATAPDTEADEYSYPLI